MSFITKRERVFNEYELYELPSRNEGKLKAYSSCTDARAWSHFGSDKSEHLVDIIKRNNEMCRPKYVPTEAIVNTLLSVKNAEITRLKRKIEEFEEMLAAYEELELTCEQKCEIAEAHAAIKEANKELNELWFDLDLSGFTGIDSEDFETGKSRGDEASRYRDEEPDIEPPQYKGDEPSQKESKGNQAGMHCACDASTNATDPRLDEMKEAIISKDAKLNAMKNTIAVMENDVCEPYCIYAHIYTALEKIFGVLCQNDKYKLYLSLMTAGKDTRCIDIKGKILYKLKVFEKFSMALIAPCSQDDTSHSQPDCPCYRAEIVSRVETTYALTSAETQQPGVDNKRAQLVADIMQNEEMKEILNKDNPSDKTELNLDDIEIECYNADEENLKRLKNLQENYDDLMTCYEGLKHDKDCLQIRCQKYEDMEKELENMKNQLREYNSLWNEKEHFRKRSEDLDLLKEQYLVLYDETTNLETELKAELEINSVKSKTIDELRNDNILLEEKLNKALMSFEKERSSVQCKIKESECTIMCQKQQIKSLSNQIDRLLEQANIKDQSKSEAEPDINLIDEINRLKEQIINLKDALYCNEEEKEQLQEEYKNKLNLINDLRMEVEDWKSSYEKMLQRNEYLEKYTENFRDEVQKLVDDNKILTEDNEAKTNAIENLREVIYRKSQEVKSLMENIDLKNAETSSLCNEIKNLNETYNTNIKALDAEKSKELQLVTQKSHELLEKVKDYDNLVQRQQSLTHTLHFKNEEFQQLKGNLFRTTEENNSLRMDLANLEKLNSLLRQEILKLQDLNNVTVNNLGAIQDEKDSYKMSLELTRKDSKILQEKLQKFKDLSDQFEELKKTHEKLNMERNKLEKDLASKTIELDNAMNAIHLTRKASVDLEIKLKNSESLITDLIKVDEAYKTLIREHTQLQAELEDKKQGFDALYRAFEDLKLKNNEKTKEVNALTTELESLKLSFINLEAEKQDLQNDNDTKNEEINNLCNNLEKKIEENRELFQQIQKLQNLEEDNFNTKSALSALRKESKDLMFKAKYCDNLQAEYDQLKMEHDKIKAQNDELQKELKRMEKDNRELNSESQILLSHSEDLEKALISARTQLVNTSVSRDPHMDILEELENLKKEKFQQYDRIRELRDKLDSTEITISELGENIQSRDYKIASLQNYINQLQDEVKRLHISLEEVVDAGEQIRDNSYQKIDQSLQSMEAHHSKATHNMKMELAKLQKENFNLEERLSISKIKSEDSTRDKHKYLSQVIHLQNEREIIVTDIKQLEIKSVGDSALSPDNCETENILTSLDRIRKFLEAKNSKSILLEQSLSKIQNSYQLVQDKADEAKKIVEKEKQKILNEKEEAIRDKALMEKQLLDLKEQLEKQISHDKCVIKDLEAEILNQKLIADKVNKSRDSYISKLKAEMQSLEELYQTATEKISELEKRLKNMSDENTKYLDIIEQVNKQLQQKSEEVSQLQTNLNDINNKRKRSESIQTMIHERENAESQTDNYIKYEDNKTQNKDYNVIAHRKRSGSHEANKVPFEKLKPFNEVQVLTAKVEPTFVFDRNNYQSYKLQYLSTGRLEQYSVACISDNHLENENTIEPSSRNMNIKETSSQGSEDMNVIDIYNTVLMDTDSSKILDNNPDNEKLRTLDKPSGLVASGLNVDSFENECSPQLKASNLLASTHSGEKDLFVIYKDSDSVNNSHYEQPPHNDDKPGLNNLKVSSVKDLPKKDQPKSGIPDSNNDVCLYGEDNFDDNLDSIKQTLNINLPRVDAISPTLSGFEADKKSLDSINTYELKSDKIKFRGENIEDRSVNSMLNYESYISTEEEQTSKNQRSVKHTKNNFVVPSDSTQVNIFSRKTSPDSTFVKNELDTEPRHNRYNIEELENVGTDNKIQTNETNNFGLDYILQGDTKTYNATQGLRVTRSDHYVDNNVIKIKNRSDSSPSRLSPGKISVTDFITVSSRTTNKSKSKTDFDGYIMVKADAVKDYEDRINELTQYLENVEKDYKKKLEVIKIQYDSNIRSILNEHNEGVKSIQGLHEDTLQDILSHHENEVENLRTMSIEAMRKADRLEKENQSLRYKMRDSGLDEEPTKITPELKRRRRSRIDTKMLSKTDVEAFNVKPKGRCNGPCTCTVDVNLSDTIRKIFEQVDVEQRKMAEQTYLKHIANKILAANVEALDYQELSFLHLKVCRIWKVKHSEEESLQKRIDSLETELINKQRHTQLNMAELDRKVAEERRRLQEVREAVCRNVPLTSRHESPDHDADYMQTRTTIIADCPYTRNLKERRSAGDLAPSSSTGLRSKRGKTDNRAVLAKLDSDERREKKLPYNDEPPTRLRRQHDRIPSRSTKK